MKSYQNKELVLRNKDSLRLKQKKSRMPTTCLIKR